MSCPSVSTLKQALKQVDVMVGDYYCHCMCPT